MHALGARVYKPSRLNFFAILTGFLFQTGFLYERGEIVGRCPLTSLFEVIIFLGWSMVLFYLLIGPAYRISLLGVFTSPLVFMLQVGALLLLPDKPTPWHGAPNSLLELHAALSVVAYGAFALASVAGFMYIMQERQLKTHHIHSIFYHLPSIHDLAVANHRLIITGFGLLTVGLGSGFAIGNIFAHSPLTRWSIGVWLLYAFILAAVLRHRISPKRVAWLSVMAFSAILLSLGGLNFITEKGAR